jgi:hypothetical protein
MVSSSRAVKTNGPLPNGDKPTGNNYPVEESTTTTTTTVSSSSQNQRTRIPTTAGKNNMKPPISSSSAGVKHNIVSSTGSNQSKIGNTTTGTTQSTALYLEALQVLNEETMLRACSLLLDPVIFDDTIDDTSDGPVTNDQSNIEDGNTTNQAMKDDQQCLAPVVVDESSATTIPPRKRQPLSTTSTDQRIQSKHDRTATRNGEDCTGMVQLQLLYDQCRQAVNTLEKEGVKLIQQQQRQRLASTTSSSTAPGSTIISTSSSTPGMVSRTKIVAGQHNNRNAMLRTGSLKRPLPSAPIATAVSNVPPSSSVIPNVTTTKGQFGNMTLGQGVRRQRLERERSDSSVSTTATSASSNALKKSRISATITTDDAIQPSQYDEASIPPPNARQFLAMLNNETTTPMPTSTPPSSNNKITQSPKNISTNATSSNKGANETNRSIPSAAVLKRKSPQSSPVYIKKSKLIESAPYIPDPVVTDLSKNNAATTTTRIQPPRASRK